MADQKTETKTEPKKTQKKTPRKQKGAPVPATTVSLGAHISKASRDKLATYQTANGFNNVHDALNHLLSELPEPEPVKEEREADPNQSMLPGCDA